MSHIYSDEGWRAFGEMQERHLQAGLCFLERFS